MQNPPYRNRGVILACDNKGALHRITKNNIKPQEKHFDYISAINKIISELKITINLIHVEGHKDQRMSLDKLTVLESMNVIADTHAKIKASTPSPPQLHHSEEIYYG